MSNRTRRRKNLKAQQALAARKETPMSESVPSSCTYDGNFMHQAYACINGVPMFYVSAWINADGTATIVPQSQRMPGALPGVIPGTTIVQNGTIWSFDPEVGFVDTGKPAEPLVKYGSDGSFISAGYNPGTGKWVIGVSNGVEIVGTSPSNADDLRQAVAQLKAAVDQLAVLAGY